MIQRKGTEFSGSSTQWQKFSLSLKEFNQINQAFIIFAIFVLVVGIYVNHEVKNNRQKAQLYTEKSMMEGYIDTLEKMQLEIKKVQHDYKNMLIGIGGFVENGQVDSVGLENFLTKNKLIESNVEIKSGTLNQLKNINIPAVKGLVSTKIIQAVQLGIDVTVECSDQITINKVDPFDLSRALGIILDNAIEACIDQDQAKLSLAFIDDERQTIIIVANTCDEPTINVEAGRSKKGANHGLGLQNLADFVESSDYVELETICVDYTFTQKLFIKK
ncbi:sensor histidine kinase [Xylocopilactobacillus apicola]|uniref:Sensor histidine kinase NatK-like C-terminal domain-containing protein n=1 Tax=Xylocopilactobacillus apicola TaxID=2932184 RepID=A0AAU9DKP1_9LACO|nr:GHKL domain-containing protein [Xylocopilactobacillus apicola]BDR59116.1 hypothetical protein XA3_15570 [Xylocopilactobacillus apicola]